MKKVFKILAVIALILTILKISDTYAKYFSKATATKELEVGQWIIKINGLDIYSEKGETVKLTLSPEAVDSESNVATGAIAPGSTWNAKIELDPIGTDVAVRYDIELDIPTTENMDLEYEVVNTIVSVDGKSKFIKTGEHTYTGIISLADVQAGKKQQITCSIEWVDTGDKDEEHTEIASTYGKKVVVPVKINCIQYLGETITEYTE